MASEKAKDMVRVVDHTDEFDEATEKVDAAVAPLLDALEKARKAWGTGDETRSIAQFNRDMNEAMGDADALLLEWGRR
jgi:hypothetical protein